MYEFSVCIVSVFCIFGVYTALCELKKLFRKIGSFRDAECDGKCNICKKCENCDDSKEDDKPK